MNRFFLELDHIAIGDVITIADKDIIKHISSVLRLRCHDKIEIVSTEQKEYVAVIDSVDKKSIVVKAVECMDVERELGARISLFQGTPKAKKLDYIVQKCVECGVHDITPVDMTYSIKKITKSGDNLIERLNKISLSAAEQSKRLYVPKVNTGIAFKELIDKLCAYDLIILLDEQEKTTTICDIVDTIKSAKSIAVIIGPEGGIADEEREALKQIAKSITLGSRILRTETAGIVILSQLSMFL